MPTRKSQTRWLRAEITTWLDQGLVDEATARRLQNHYQLPPSDSPTSLVARILAILGSVLIGLGVILLFAYNWQDIPKNGKLALSFLPLSIGLALGAFTMSKRPRASLWKESSGISIGLACAAALGLVGQTLQLPSDLSQFYFIWALCTLPFLWALESKALFLLAGFQLIACVSTTGYHDTSAVAFRFLVIASPLLAYFILERRQFESRFSFFIFAVSTTSAFAPLGYTQASSTTPLVWLALAAATFYLWDTRSALNQANFTRNPTGMIAKVALTAFALALTFSDIWDIGSHRDHSSTLGIVIVTAATIAYLLLLAERFYLRSWAEIPWAAIPLLVAAALGLAAYDLIELDNAALVFTPYVALLGIAAIVDGYRSASIARLNHGLAILLVLAVIRFFDGDWGMLERGIGFIVIGILFLAANIHFLKRRKEASHADA